MPSVEGVVTIVQEGRFQLRDDRGASHQFILGPNAPSETRQLRPLADRQARVRVSYEDAARLIARVARRIDLVEPSFGESAA